ncbi:7-cyano-7-deazaguanine synthase QueC [Acinetobacter pollinis]|jgi:7-cyano-7-deazaguanine synthase|uniref:7-cyano-7-deazaguanine synthase n=1 Tax=Acinetobacter pollinis TaxID=2605270 RepID=A0ABU6DPT4_9GAMM|nr:7-cyano-7-deazaguanine synthase QueC [Acinetobacter pollinis]MBF7690456.1 7-cyano-7-deazaguanine synthase QueC [Acinetobacter pollinis]MBF7692548.1 7-cyano-7-deazaguanine synthase QueC [Acinetobacter pollinis]MBF7697539.1 7-cyano-7-deazaguanine synthase QueC [Acinetobacter pollinis]MBF7699636.1 7-cyano-7-deazaguanine synthase QueC [Acinetobacter pollinis]MEB5475873.1 7-cyano-7-deazaguanine synthase QueC [Acinetobacter pollinis]
MRPRAIVLLSGGLDSTTCLAWAQSNYDCIALSFQYGQRSSTELEAAKHLTEKANIPHRIINIDLGNLGGSALTDHSIDVPEEAQSGIPITYVPARNTIFLSYALAAAEVFQAEAIVIGVNAVDYSGYPDCRPEFVEAFAHLAALATKAGVEGKPLKIETPLLHLSKGNIIRLGIEHGVDYSQTVSCYQADEQGRACGKCDSCRLRKEGFLEAKVDDPTRYVS